MKTIRLLIAALLFTTAASAQSYRSTSSASSPTIYLFAAESVDEAPARRSRTVQTREVIEEVTGDYSVHHRTGFQQVGKPLIILAQRNNKFSFGIGGYINMRAGYDLGGIVNNLDFIPSDIPIPGNYATRQKLMMDASTSRLFMRGFINTESLGKIEIFIDGDYRGVGVNGTLRPRVRSAYMSMLGFTIGRDVTTFCDLDAAPRTVDFQGPNAYNFNFAQMIRYEYTCDDSRFKMGIAAEFPNFSGTYGENFASIPQRMPDIPFYAQFAWGANHHSHVRLSAVARDAYVYDKVTEDNISLFGWGAQVSARVEASDIVKIFFNGVYGSGITKYIQDLTGTGLDFTPNPANMNELQTTPMYGMQGAAQFDITDRLSLSGGYSMVRVLSRNGFYSNEEYKIGDYIFGNLFYNITPRMEVACEYLYGTRRNMDDIMNHANRINLMVQYNF